MNSPIEKSVVLVGAGNAHLVFVKRLRMSPIPGVAVTLISEAATIPYSAMVPGHLGGEYSWDDITIDLVRLCRASNVRFLAERVERLDPGERRVHFAGRPPLPYDVLSLGLGSDPAVPGDLPMTENSFAMRPLAAMTERLDRLDRELTRTPRPFEFVIVGGGASGCELALAIHKRLVRHPALRLTLLQGDARLVPQFPRAAARILERICAERGIAVRVNARVISGRNGSLLLASGEAVPFDAVLWATQGTAPALLGDSGLGVDAAGFLKVLPTLQSENDPAVFGTGDCVAFNAYPDLPRNGVHAVRQGAILFANVNAFLHEKAVIRFQPQRLCLCLMNMADGSAFFNYGPFTWRSRWARRLKDRIDRAWIMKHTRNAPMAATGADQLEGEPMRCGGCGSKISSDVLSAVLKRLDIPDDPRILLGTKAGEDAAVHRARPELFGPEPEELLEVQTVDFFTAFVDDPYQFGQIAACNAVSDLYAMNARPFSALAIATLPNARGPIQEAMLYEMLCGAVDAFKPLGVILTGGHTSEGSELALGFAVTGFAEEGRLFQKKNLRPGDILVLTKPLGSGALLAAWMRGDCQAGWFESLLQSMRTANAAAGAIFAQAGVTACTDITGFGLAGHLLEMLDASRVSARIASAQVPLYAGFTEVTGRGIVSTLHADNAKMSCRVVGANPLPAWLFDPQTSGGLLAGVRADAAEDVLRRLREAGCKDAARIGEVIALAEKTTPQILLG